MKYENKNILITGAAHGIGSGFARSFSKHGANLILVDIDKDAMEKLLSELPDGGEEHLVYIKDLGKFEDRIAIFEDLQEKNIGVDVLVNNVGIGYRGYVTETSWEALEKVIDVNVKGTTHFVWLFLPDMKKKNAGGIINVASTGSFCGADVASIYTGTKAYVTNFTEGLSMELFGTNIQAVAAHPGATDTNFWEASGWVDSDYNKDISMMSPDAVAEEFINALNQNKSFIIAGLKNKMMVFLSKFIPREMLKKMAVQKYK